MCNGIEIIPKSGVKDLTEVKESIEKMRNAKEGTFIKLSEDEDIVFPDILPLPKCVVILIDKGDVSTSEQFLLDAKTSRKVILIGATTYGALDYSSIRPFALPSGERTLWLPTTRSRRLPENPIDGIGIKPDIQISNSKDHLQDTVLSFAIDYLEKK